VRRIGVEHHEISCLVAALEASAVKMAQALDTLTPERGARIGVTNPLVGTTRRCAPCRSAGKHPERKPRAPSPEPRFPSGLLQPPAAPLQEQALPRDAQDLRGFLEPSVRAVQRILHHRAFEELHGFGQ